MYGITVVVAYTRIVMRSGVGCLGPRAPSPWSAGHRVTGPRDDPDPRPATGNGRLLQEAFSHRAVRDDASFDQALAVAGAAGAQPLLINAEQVVVGGQRGSLADIREHIAEADELARELGED